MAEPFMIIKEGPSNQERLKLLNDLLKTLTTTYEAIDPRYEVYPRFLVEDDQTRDVIEYSIQQCVEEISKLVNPSPVAFIEYKGPSIPE